MTAIFQVQQIISQGAIYITKKICLKSSFFLNITFPTIMLLPLFHYQFVQLLKIPHKQIHTVKPPTNGQLSTTATSLQRQPVLPDGPYIDSCLKTFLQR